MSRIRTFLASLLVAGAALAAADVPAAQHAHHAHGHAAETLRESAPVQKREAPWTDATLEMAARLAVQDAGRIKPLSTYAGFTLLRLNGKRSIETPAGEKLGPTAWLLDVLFFPYAAAEYPHFLVENDEVIAAIGLRPEGKKKRDHYSYAELSPGIERLFSLAREYVRIEEKHRTPVQQQVVILSSNVGTFEDLVGQMDFTLGRLPLGDAPKVVGAFGDAEDAPFSEVVAHTGELYAAFQGEGSGRAAVAPVLQLASSLANGSQRLALVPPVVPVQEELEWSAPGELFARALQGETIHDPELALVATLEELGAARQDPQAFERALASVLASNQALAEARGEYAKVPLEVTYYKIDLIYKSLLFFVFAFVGAALLWLRPKGKILYGVTAGSALVGTLLLVGAITMRCVIRGRPPVSNLYETLLFVGGVGAVTALLIELMNRRRLALSAAALLGAISLFLANGYETLDKQDTMPSLVAVLDTNYWLAIHVTAITAGYAAGMLAAVMGSFYLLAKLFDFRRGDRRFYAGLGRMVYGILAFAVIFSTVGTILGGIWANDSWGRFWGWDPKENGALLIVLSQLAILHARMGGYLRELGVCMAAAFGGTVIAFSWFHVNLLGVGLHSYGFTEGIHTALWTYYVSQWGIVGLGGVAYLLERRRLGVAPPKAAAAPALRGKKTGEGTQPA